MLKKKYLVTATTFPKFAGDSAPRFVLDTCIALQQQGVEILVLAPHAKGSKFSEVIEGVKVVRYPYFFPFYLEQLSGEGIVAKLKRNPLLNIVLPFFLFSQLFFTALYISRFKPDHILANWIIPQGLVTYLLSIVYWRMRYSVISLGGDAVLINSNGTFRYLGRLILKRATHVVAVSSNIKKILIDVGVPERRVNIVSMGVWLSEESISINRDIDFVFVGRLEEKKGVEYLLDALYLLHSDGMRFNAVIVGSGTLYGELSKRVSQSELCGSVHLVGALPLNEVKNILGRSKIFVLPSINMVDDVEGMPTIILDAMSQMAVVVATDAGGVTDVVRNNVNGVLVTQKKPAEIASTINKLLTDEVLRIRLSMQAYELIKMYYTYDVIAKKLINIFEMDSRAGLGG